LAASEVASRPDSIRAGGRRCLSSCRLGGCGDLAASEVASSPDSIRAGDRRCPPRDRVGGCGDLAASEVASCPDSIRALVSTLPVRGATLLASGSTLSVLGSTRGLWRLGRVGGRILSRLDSGRGSTLPLLRIDSGVVATWPRRRSHLVPTRFGPRNDSIRAGGRLSRSLGSTRGLW
jgi:hypothetical protein